MTTNPHIHQDPIGHDVDTYRVLGKETDATGRWVGADMELYIHDRGRFLLNVITKAQHEVEVLRARLSVDDDPSVLFEEGMPDPIPSFVVNDREITDDILERKFNHRRVEQDLADSLWFVADEASEA